MYCLVTTSRLFAQSLLRPGDMFKASQFYDEYIDKAHRKRVETLLCQTESETESSLTLFFSDYWKGHVYDPRPKGVGHNRRVHHQGL